MTIHQFHPKGYVGWQERLDMAGDEHDVIGVVRDFLAQLAPEEIASLPEPCRPGKIVDANDVTSFAFALMRHHCEDADPRDLVHKLAAFFSNASIRLSQILAHRDDDAEDDFQKRA